MQSTPPDSWPEKYKPNDWGSFGSQANILKLYVGVLAIANIHKVIYSQDRDMGKNSF
jgi:hypothetical protein